MELTVADQRVLVFNDQISFDEAQKLAWGKKIDAFGTINKIESLWSKPKDEDFTLIYHEHRYEPFWHVVAKAHYLYNRNTEYEVPTKGSEVNSVECFGNVFDVKNGHIHLPVLEHCTQDEIDEVLVEGMSGKSSLDLKKYLSLSPKQVKNLEKAIPKNSIVLPPQTRISAIMRDSLSKMIKGIQADAILEETVKVECVDLYYHPVYAFKYKWISKNKEAIVEIDGLTGEMKLGERVFSEYLGKIMDTIFLFDLGSDAAGMLIPGGSIAVKIAKKYVDTRKTK